MNNVTLIGRVTKDIETRLTTTQKTVARFTLAVNRRTKDDEADFINCQVWGKTAENMEKYVHKGDKIGLTGRIQTGSYEKDGHRVYTTEVVVETLEFLENKRNSSEQKPEPKTDEFDPVPDDFADDDLPF